MSRPESTLAGPTLSIRGPPVLWSGVMTPAHLALVLLVVVIWGLTFVATRWALDDFSPPQLTALRFLIAAAPALVLARPGVPWRTLVPVGLTLFLGQFMLQFFGIALGMPPGLAAVVVRAPRAPLSVRHWRPSLRPPPTRSRRRQRHTPGTAKSVPIEEFHRHLDANACRRGPPKNERGHEAPLRFFM
jgi:hypothetical protein